MNEIEKNNEQIVNRYNNRKKIYIIAIIVVLFIVIFIQKEIAVKILTILTLLGVQAIIKSTTGLERAKVECIKKKDYKIISEQRYANGKTVCRVVSDKALPSEWEPVPTEPTNEDIWAYFERRYNE